MKRCLTTLRRSSSSSSRPPRSSSHPLQAQQGDRGSSPSPTHAPGPGSGRLADVGCLQGRPGAVVVRANVLNADVCAMSPGNRTALLPSRTRRPRDDRDRCAAADDGVTGADRSVSRRMVMRLRVEIARLEAAYPADPGLGKPGGSSVHRRDGERRFDRAARGAGGGCVARSSADRRGCPSVCDPDLARRGCRGRRA